MNRIGAELVQVESTDGTSITCFVQGSGPPLVLVHGTSADHTRWAPVLAHLADRFTVFAIDRRGRGASGDSPSYALEREVEDVVSIVDSIQEPVNLLGHSYGGLLSLWAAPRAANLRRLIVYEGVIYPDELQEDVYPPGAIERIEDLVRAGDRDGAVTVMMSEIAGLSPDQVEYLKTLPAWEARMAAAETIPRELRADRDHRPDPAELARVGVPTLLLLGADSPEFYRVSTERLARDLPDARIAVLPGQQHAAMDTGPDVFLAEVFGFLA